tara:strand:+ start:15772 stop:16851 length:1080 start_codon:yes stop_codon:yes gene_type:complete
MKNKVLYVIPSLEMGGAELLLVNWLNKFDGSKYNWEVHLMVIGSNARMLPSISNKKVIIHHIKAIKKNYIFKLPKIFLLMYKINPHIIHSHLYKANILVRFFKIFNKKVKVINHYHGLSLWIGKFKLFTDKYTQFLIDKALVVSDKSFYVRRKRERICTKKLQIFYNFCNQKKIPTNVKNTKKKLTLSMACRLIKLKNIPKVINFVSYLNKQNISAQLLIAGEGPEEESIRAIIKKKKLEDSIKLLGFKNDLSQFYKDTHVYIIASDTEDLPMSMIEAMSYGCHIISSDVGGIKQVLDKCEGLVVPEITKEYYQKIKVYLNSIDIKKASRINSNLVEKEFLVNNYLKKTLNLYTELISK